MTLEVQNGHFEYKKGQPIISGLNFKLVPGEILAILGANGVGKTTLINTITGMNKWQKGQTLVHDRPLQSYSARARWQRLGYVTQARASVFSYTVIDMVLLGKSTHLGTFSRPSPQDRQAAIRVLERLEIGHLVDRQCNEISGGELQLVFIARAMIAEPTILFLDEPESHLDFKKQLIILDIIQRLAAEDGIICVLNTHFPNHALRIAHKVLLMSDPHKHQFGPTQDVLTEAAIQRCFGVNAILSPIEVDDQILQSIYPVSIASQDANR